MMLNRRECNSRIRIKERLAEILTQMFRRSMRSFQFLKRIQIGRRKLQFLAAQLQQNRTVFKRLVFFTL